MTELALRPRSSTEIIDLAVRLLRRHFGALFTIALAGSVPVLIVQLGLLSVWRDDPTRLAAGFLSGYGLLSYVILIAVRALMFTALLVGADDALRTGTVDVGGVLRRSVPRVGPALVVVLLGSLAVGLGFLLFVVPGVYLALRLATALPGAAVEGDGPLEAMGRSWRRSDGYLGHTFTTLLLLLLIFLVVGIAVGIVSGVGFAVGGGLRGISWTALALSQVFGTLVSVVTYPLLTNALLVLWYDLRVRREGYDVEAMAAALGTAG